MDSRLEKQMIAMRYWLLGKGYHKAMEALELAMHLHDGTRRDGSPEFSHQLSIAHYLKTISSSLDDPENVIILGLLHDSIEDGKANYLDLNRQFGPDIAVEVGRLSKLSTIDSSKKEDTTYYGLLSLSRNTAIVKGADRIHNLETMPGAFSKEKKEIYLNETETFVLPMLKNARRRFPTQELAYQNIKYILENQIRLLRSIEF